MSAEEVASAEKKVAETVWSLLCRSSRRRTVCEVLREMMDVAMNSNEEMIPLISEAFYYVKQMDARLKELSPNYAGKLFTGVNHRSEKFAERGR